MVFQAAKRIASSTPPTRGWSSAGSTCIATSTRAALHRPDRPARRQPRLLLIDWRAPAAAVFYQATAAGPARRRTPPGAAVGRRPGRRRRGRAARRRAPRRPGGRRRGRADGALSRARDRSMHSIVATIQAEQDQAIRAPHRGVVSISRRPRHRQDRRRAAPRGVPALHRPPPLRVRRRAGRRPQRRVHALHRAGAALPRRDRRRAALARRGRRRRARDPPRRAGGRRDQGLGPDGRSSRARRAAGARCPDASSASSGATTCSTLDRDASCAVCGAS